MRDHPADAMKRLMVGISQKAWLASAPRLAVDDLLPKPTALRPSCPDMTRRNVEIYRHRKNGSTYRELAAAFDLSAARVSQICEREVHRRAIHRARKGGWKGLGVRASMAVGAHLISAAAAVYCEGGREAVAAMLPRADKAILRTIIETLESYLTLTDDASEDVSMNIHPLFALQSPVGVWAIDVALEAA